MSEKPTRKDAPPTKRVKKPSTEHGLFSEARVAKNLGARLTPMSGAMVGSKGDSKVKYKAFKVLIESKATTSDSFSIKLAWLQKIHGEALIGDSIPALTVSFVDATGKPKSSGDWVMLTLEDYHHLMELANGR